MMDKFTPKYNLTTEEISEDDILNPNKVAKKKLDSELIAESMKKGDNKHELEKKMLEDHSYPLPTQDNFQEAIYTKREFIIHRIPERGILDSYETIKEYRDSKCARDFKLTETQTLVSNFINPNTPYKGLLLYHGTGVGKSCGAIAIAEKFKPMVEKYGTKIHVLVPGPLNKENFLEEIIKCTGETYLDMHQDKTLIISPEEKNKIKKNAYNSINQYYRIMTYRSLYRRVLGEKMKDKIISHNKIKSVSRKLESGEVERDRPQERIDSLDNTLIIVDEAHNLTGNEYGYALRKIIDNSKNLKVVLLSATPMKNLADDIVELINYLRPPKYPMMRDKIFTSQRGHLMEFKPGGQEYFRKMIRGYVSYLRGADPLTFAERIDMGEIPPGLSFTKVIRCFMYPFQYKTYRHVVETQEDSLDRNSEAVSNFVFPGFSKNKKDIEGYYGIDGINEIKSQLKNNAENLNKKIASTVLEEHDIKNPQNLMYLSNNNKTISGDIFSEEYLKYFSIKFHAALTTTNETVKGKRGPGLIFTYSNFVKFGIELYQEVLQRNGYLEYQEIASNYNIRDDTRCYYCGQRFANHSRLANDIPKHEYHPATYITITGKSDDNVDQIPEEKHKILRNVFNNTENKNGKFIKIVLGSKVMNEGITLKNIKEILVLDVHFNLGKVDQVIGRGIRFCTHYNTINESNPYPKVEIYKFVASAKGEMSTEEELYEKAEKKYRLIKVTERITQEEAIDCPLNRNGNIFPEELERYGNCGTKDNPCPAICGYMPCEYKCGDKLLNIKYYDPERAIYRKVNIDEIDYSTYTNELVGEEIEYSKDKIKEMYKLGEIYTEKDILKYVKKTYPPDKRDMFDDFYVYKALDELIPISQNDFNNFHDTIMNHLNKPGYLIYRDRFYIFQPFDENEDVPMYYRKNHSGNITNKLNIKEYVQNTDSFKRYRTDNLGTLDSTNKYFGESYDFESVQEYYDNRDEFDYVGIVDQESTRKKLRIADEINDVFKIREKRPKIISKKRETGVPSFKGAVCKTSKDKKYLVDIAKKLNINLDEITADDRTSMCNVIEAKLFDMEKYSTSANKNKITYLIVPKNHPIIPFPLNLEDRMKDIISKIQTETRLTLEPKIKKLPLKGNFPDIKYVKYEIDLNKNLDKYREIVEKYGAYKEGNKWIINVE